MANPVMTTYVQVGKVEEVSEEIGMISPTNTPVLSMIGSEGVDNTLYTWLEDQLDPPAVNAAVEGADAPAANQVPVSTRSNTTQIFTKTVKTTGSADKMALHGKPNKEFARQMAKKSKEIKRDVEYALVGTRQTKNLGSSAVARQFDGVQAQFDASMVLSAKAFTSQATNQPLSEALILQAAQNAYATGGEPDTLVVKPADSIKIAGFAAASGRQRFIDSDGLKIVNVVNTYVTPFGEIKVVMDRWMASQDALLIEPSMWKLRTYRGWFTKQLPEGGDYRSSEIIGEYGLSHKNFFADCLVTDLSA